MLNIGLTGGIAAGKSTVAAVLTALGARLIDADVLAREVVEVGTDGLAQVVRAFGPEVLQPDGSLDRPALGRIVFNDEEARARLGAVVHPLVTDRTRALLSRMPPGQIVVHDVPLIVENDLADRYHLVLVAGAGEIERHRRLVTGRGLSEADAWSRIRAQTDDQRRRAVADVWLETERPKAQVRGEIEDLWHTRLAPFAHNIAQNRRAERGPGPAMLMEPPGGTGAVTGAGPTGLDRPWAVQAEHLLARIRHAVGEQVETADHIGSTAVPGLVAKDVIDLQLGVVDLDAAVDLDEPLRTAGFIRHTAIEGDVPKPHAPEPAQWRKRLYTNADPGRPVNLHVRHVGGPGWRYALAFRDWLRADGEARAEYADLKRRTVAGTATTGEYAEAKEPWFTAAWPRLQSWIGKTGWHPGQG
ncbi:dephospho-CoA kinase [Pseudactinotalea sp. Z1748]|uniref:dephospho-CoA kinase n=1 Tax=Pseudactinotalea sp. Z1748 TaxID=3413027 RepID=UPI003C7BA0EF